MEELKIHLHSTSDDKIIKTVSIMLMLEMDRKNYMKHKGKHNGNSNNHNDLFFFFNTTHTVEIFLEI